MRFLDSTFLLGLVKSKGCHKSSLFPCVGGQGYLDKSIVF